MFLRASRNPYVICGSAGGVSVRNDAHSPGGLAKPDEYLGLADPLTVDGLSILGKTTRDYVLDVLSAARPCLIIVDLFDVSHGTISRGD